MGALVVIQLGKSTVVHKKAFLFETLSVAHGMSYFSEPQIRNKTGRL